MASTSAPLRAVSDSRVVVKDDLSDLKYLTTGKDVDCLVKYKSGRTRSAHKVFLGRCLRFSPDTLERQQTFVLDDIEDFEAEWLLRWVYCGPVLSSFRFDGTAHAKINTTDGDTRLRALQVASLYGEERLHKAAAEAVRAWCGWLLAHPPREWKGPSGSNRPPTATETVARLVRPAFRRERSHLTPEWVIDLLCEVVGRHKAALHAEEGFCGMMLEECSGRFATDDRMVLKGCQNCEKEMSVAWNQWMWR